MTFEIDDKLAEKFKAAVEKTGEDEKKVLERMFKTYVYDVFARYEENYYALESFLSFPRGMKKEK